MRLRWGSPTALFPILMEHSIILHYFMDFPFFSYGVTSVYL